MRTLTHSELQAVGGGLDGGDGLGLTIGLIALSPTPLVIGVGVAALLIYAWC